MGKVKKKIALIFGITGQDGSYLAEFLLKKNYIIHGVKRRSSSANTERIDHLFDSLNFTNKNFFIHYGDISDGTSTLNIISKVKPDEIYNLQHKVMSEYLLMFQNTPLILLRLVL